MLRCSTTRNVDSIFRTYGSLGRQEMRPQWRSLGHTTGSCARMARNAMPQRDAMRRYRATGVEEESGEKAIQGEGRGVTGKLGELGRTWWAMISMEE